MAEYKDGQPIVTVEINEEDSPMNPISYTDRGDPASVDFSKADFSTDGQWHVLDLSSIVPEGAVLIHLRIDARTAKKEKNSIISFRKNGNVNDINKETMILRSGDKDYFESKFVVCDANRKIEYWLSDVNWITLDVLVRGWF